MNSWKAGDIVVDIASGRAGRVFEVQISYIRAQFSNPADWRPFPLEHAQTPQEFLDSWGYLCLTAAEQKTLNQDLADLGWRSA